MTPSAPFVTNRDWNVTPPSSVPLFTETDASIAIPNVGAGTSTDSSYKPSPVPSMPAQEIFKDFDDYIIHRRRRLITFTFGQAPMGWADFLSILDIEEELESRYIDMYMEVLRVRLRNNLQVYDYHRGGVL